MNPSPYDHPDLTAYALGELNNVESARVRQVLAQSPETRAEYELILQTVNAMREQAPPIPQRTLSPRQRETILAMGQLRASNNPGRDRARSLAWGVAKLAAAASITAGAFALGMKYADRLEAVVKSSSMPAPTVNGKNPSPTNPSSIASVADEPKNSATAPSQPETSPTVKTVADATTDQTGLALTTPVAPPVTPAPEVVVTALPQSGPKPEAAPVVAQAAPAPKPVLTPSLKAFALTKAQPESSILLQPRLLRPKIQSAEFAGLTVAAPLPDRLRNAPKPAPSRKPEPQPALVIHDWKAAVASCPWDSSRRLIRVFAQMPVEQAAVDTNDQDYHLTVKFDPAQVQGYRLIMEKNEPPTNAGKLAMRFAWYEVIPTKNYAATHDRPVTLGQMEVAQPRGTPPGVSLPPLKFQDVGSDWSEKGEAFVFETAMVGFNLLLQGTDNVGSLNHRLVLDLAQQAKGDDPERAKFIHAVQQAQKAVGL